MYFFPTAYDDELLYSVLARYCKQTGNLNAIHNVEELYDSRNIVSSPELPGNLNILTSNLPLNCRYDSDFFINSNTIFPYIATFLPENRAREVYEIMKDGQASIIYNKVGLVSGNIKNNKNFRFCPQCLKEDIDNYGEGYWHRVHQIIGVFMCPIHKKPVYDSIVPLRGNYRQRYIPASPDVCEIKEYYKYSFDTVKKLNWIADDVYKILQRPFDFQSLLRKKYLYMEKLIERQIANMNSMIHQKNLRKELINFWSIEVLELLQCPISISADCNWLNVLTRKNESVSLPIRHILLMRFLGISIDDFTCDLPINTFHKDLWVEKLIALANEKQPIKKIAVIINSTPKTVRKQMLKLGVEPYWKNEGNEKDERKFEDTQEFKERLVNAKEKWLALHNDNPNLSRNQLKKLKPSIYNRLVKYDKEWLYSNSSSKGCNNILAEWEQRDKEILIQVHETVKKMHEGKPERVQWLTVGGKLGINGWFGKSRNRMPLVKEYLDSEIECLADFHVRKITWALHEIELSGEAITKCKLLEWAGVKERYVDVIRESIKVILRENGYDETLID